MRIPLQLEALLKGDDRLHGSVLTSLGEFEPWLRLSGTPFFPEYTDHSDRHVYEVLQTLSSLIRDNAWSALTPADAAMLCFATLLHDSAMHLSEDGFTLLIKGQGWCPSLPDEEPWAEMWTDFLSEASRFDGAKLVELFGNTEPVHRPSNNPLHWQLRDRLLIGEFVRRHHARLAHEIAVSGVPGSGGDPLSLRGLPSDLADLAGLIARSHGMELRNCVTHLSKTDERAYKGVHSVFLMALLRVGDYLQMQAERAPQQVLRVKKLRSPCPNANGRYMIRLSI